MRIGMAAPADLGVFLVAVGIPMTVYTFRNSISILDLSRCKSVVYLVAEGTLFLVTGAGLLEGGEDGNVALRTLLHSQWLYILIKKCGSRRYLFDFVSQIDLSGSRLSGGGDDHQRPK